MTFGNLIFFENIYGTALLPWLLVTTLVCLCETWMTMRLWEKYAQQPQLTALTNYFSIADFVTLGRGFLVAGVAGFLLLPEPAGWYVWLPGSLYFMAVFADYVDGYLARLHNSASSFGAAIDRNFDALTTMIGSLLGILYGHLPSWYFTVGLAFYVFSLATWIIKKTGREVLDLPSNYYRRIVGGSNAIFIGLALTPVLPGNWLTILAAIFSLLILAGFFRDWFCISGLMQELPFIKGTHNKLHSKINL
jgi:CDP-diacylglycerol--glycerol-3-phosphate 3-phosphatidyltransferase